MSTEQNVNALQTEEGVAQHTFRATVPALEAILYKPFKVLDHGFIRVLDYMGNEESITQAARVSYGKGTRHTSENQKLIHYLMKHSHTTPFEMCEIKLHVKLPIFVARQWIRHRTANVNEYSARYSVLNKEYYLPALDHIAAQSQTNKQGRQENALDEIKARRVLALLQQDAEQCYKHYMEMLNISEEGSPIDESSNGLTRELARMNLSMNYYTQWYWKIDLHNLLHFLMLRAHPNAQFEIREYAQIILDIVAKWVPYTYEAFMNYVVKAHTFSEQALQLIRKIWKGEEINFKNSKMSQREWQELQTLLGPVEKY